MHRHNIIGCEAVDGRDRRLAAFSLAHGSIVVMPRRSRFPLGVPLAFAAGVVAAIAAALLLGQP